MAKETLTPLANPEAKPSLSSTHPEQVKEISQFSAKERQALLKDGAVIYRLTGETIAAQRARLKAKCQPCFWSIPEEEKELLDTPSRLTEVAIYPDPERFFIDGSNDHDLGHQKLIAVEEGKKLRQRLGVTGIEVIIPEEPATLTELTFQHLEKTGQRLFSLAYAEVHSLDFIYARTQTSCVVGSFVSPKGSPSPEDGLSVDKWNCNEGYHNLWAVRLVVPKESAAKE